MELPSTKGTQSKSGFQTKPHTAASKNSRKDLLRMKGIDDETSQKNVSHYHLIKNMEEKDIRNLSKVIENSIVSQMRRGNF